MRGGGTDAVYSAPTGTAFVNLSENGANHRAVNWNGGRVNIATGLNLLAGNNTLTFAYNVLANDHADWQNMGDEGWALTTAS